MGKMADIMNWAKKEPLTAAGVALPAVGMAAGMGVDAFLGVESKFGAGPGLNDANRLRTMLGANAAATRALEREKEMRAAKAQQTAMMLMQTNPHLAAQLLAGRRIPDEAVVIGGQPRVDLFQQVVQDTMDQNLPRQRRQRGM